MERDMAASTQADASTQLLLFIPLQWSTLQSLVGTNLELLEVL